MFLPTGSLRGLADVVVPSLSRDKCEQLIEMFCAGGEFELAQKLAAYADGLSAGPGASDCRTPK